MSDEFLETLYELLELYFDAGITKTGPINGSDEVRKIEPALESAIMREDIYTAINALICPRRKNIAYSETLSLCMRKE